MSNAAPSIGVLGGVRATTTEGLLQASSGGLSAATTFSPAEVAEDGGWLVTATGSFDASKPVNVWFVSASGVLTTCYSGVVGNGETIVPKDATQISFVSPPLPPGTYSVRIRTVDLTSTVTITDVITVVKQSFTTVLYSLRSGLPYPRYPGAFSIRDEKN